MTNNRYIRICEKKRLEELFYSVNGIDANIFTWHTTLQAAKKYYAKHHETTKKELMWSKHGSPYLPLYPRIAKS